MLDVLAFLHQRFGFALAVLCVVLLLWGLVSFATRRAVTGGFRSAYLLTIGLTAVQGGLGLASLAIGGHPRELLHIVYGVFAILFLPAVYFYAGRRKPDTEAMLLTGATAFAAIAFVRGFMTG